MASGFMQRFKGKIMAAELWVPKGGLYDSASGYGGGSVQGMVRIPIQATAAQYTDFTAVVPTGAVLLSATMITTTAFTGNTATIALGNAAADASYVQAVDCKAAQYLPLTLLTAAYAALASMPAPTSGKNLFARLTQTATYTNVGTGQLIIEYAV